MALTRTFFDTDFDTDLDYMDRTFNRMLSQFGFPATTSAVGVPSATTWGTRWPAVTAGMPTGALTASSRFPALDVADVGDSVVVHAELPGMTKDQINLDIQDGRTLVISGENKQSSEYDRDQWRVRERSFGRFERRVLLPRDIDVANVKANFDNGLLEVKVGKKQETTEKKPITIQ